MADNIRLIGQENIIESLRLSQFAFQYDMSEEEEQERIANFKPEQGWGYYVEEQLAAKLFIHKLQTWINGRSFEMGGIGGVATWPEYRRHGMVKQLLVHALQTMKAAGQTVSFLHPFEFPFYRKFGWETYTEFKKYEIPKELIINQFHSTGQMKRTSDWRLLNEVYQAYAKQFNGMLNRNEEWWIRQVIKKDNQSALYYNEKGIANGYILYKVKNKEMLVNELVFLDESARSGIWKYIADHDSMMDKVVLKAPADDQLAYILRNPRIKQEVMAYFMARIVDLVPFLEKLPMAAGLEKHKLEMHVTDEFAPWNNGVFSVKWSPSGKAKVKSIVANEQPKNKAAAVVIICDISTLSAMFLGYQRPTLLRSIGQLQASDAAIALLEQVIPLRTTYLMDFF